MDGISFKNVLLEETIDLSARAVRDKEELFRMMTGHMYRIGRVTDVERFVEALEEREEKGSTYMGNGIAVPHGKSKAVKEATAVFWLCRPFLYRSGGEEAIVHMVMMLAIPAETENVEYIRMLANAARLLVNDEFLTQARKAGCSKKGLLDAAERQMRYF